MSYGKKDKTFISKRVVEDLAEFEGDRSQGKIRWHVSLKVLLILISFIVKSWQLPLSPH